MGHSDSQTSMLAKGKRAQDKLFPVARSDYNKFVYSVATKICGIKATSHSLRAGWATDAFLRGMSEAEVMTHVCDTTSFLRFKNIARGTHPHHHRGGKQ